MLDNGAWHRLQKAMYDLDEPSTHAYSTLPKWVQAFVEETTLRLNDQDKTLTIWDVAAATHVIERIHEGYTWMSTQNWLGHYFAAIGRPLPKEFF